MDKIESAKNPNVEQHRFLFSHAISQESWTQTMKAVMRDPQRMVKIYRELYEYGYLDNEIDGIAAHGLMESLETCLEQTELQIMKVKDYEVKVPGDETTDAP